MVALHLRSAVEEVIDNFKRGDPAPRSILTD
jgi:hypothetical protein